MHLRSLKQSVWRWPPSDQVLEDVQIWAQQQQQWIPSLQLLGLFDSYVRCTTAFYTDLDFLAVDVEASGGQVERQQQLPLADFPLSCHALVFTHDELEQRLNDGARIATELRRDQFCLF